MRTSRRGFVGSSLSLLPLAAFPVPKGLSEMAPQVQPTLPAIDPSVIQYWNDSVRTPSQAFRAGAEVKGGPHPNLPKNATFVFFDPQKGFVPAGSIKPTDIQGFPESGDVKIELHVERFRPSAVDAASLATLGTGTLRIDVQQATPLPDLSEALAWTAMATLVTGNKSAPAITALKFDPGTAWGQFQSIPLTKGLGFWSWNMFMKRRQGFFGQMLGEAFNIAKTAEPYLPLLGIPGIAVSGLKYIDQILGAVQAEGSSQWLFQGLDTAICATKEGYDTAGGDASAKLVLTSGNYLVMYEDDVSKLSNMDLQNGLVVPKNTDKLKVFDAALTGITYMAISVKSTAATKADAKKA
jgi:hypothetical protein